MSGPADDAAAPGSDSREFITIGRVLRAHGLYGNIIVESLTDQPGRFDAGTELRLGPDRRAVTVASARPYKGKLLVVFDEISDRTQAEGYRHHELAIAADEVGDLPEGELWIHEIVGRSVRDADHRVVGVVVGIEENPAHDLLVVRDGDGKEILVPMVRDFMEPLERESDRVEIHPPPGLVPDADA